MAHVRQALFAVFCGLLSIPPPAHAALVISEVYFDPPGPDEGAEWVELHNSGALAAPLEGVFLESGNGSAPGQWRRFWEGAPGEWIEPDGYFVVGGAYRDRPPDVLARCDLQNGPDGVRLGRETWELDRVGWGDHLFSEYFEGDPAPIPRSGDSLARVDDRVDHDDNGRDFAAAEPSPGRRNHPRVDLDLSIRAVKRPFPVPSGAASVPARARLLNRGRETASIDSVRLILDGHAILPSPVGSTGGIPPGDSVVCEVMLVPRETVAIHRWTGRVRHPADENPENDLDTLCLRAWPPPLRISEIAPRPAQGSTEWIELRVSGDSAIPLAGWRVEDAAGSVLRLDEARPGEPEEFLVLVREGASAPTVPPIARISSWSGAWPSLNDAAGRDGAADTLWLFDPEGLLADWAVWGEAGRGETWIRGTDSGEAQGLDAWFAVSAAKATPGAPNPEIRALPFTGARGMAPAGISIARHPDGMWVRLPEELEPDSWCLRVFDLEGRELWRRDGRAEAGASRWIRWDGRDRRGDIPSGLVLVEFRSRTVSGRAQAMMQSLWVAR